MSGPFSRLTALLAAVGALLILPSAAAAQLDAVSTFTWTKNMHPLGHSARNVPLENASPVDGIFNSDLAFWGKTAYQGTYEGFRIVDVSDPENPVEINNYDECSPASTQGNQGDVVVWRDILVRSWNSPATATSSCDGQLVGQGFEGLHVFDISNPADPDLVGSVPLDGLPNLVTIDEPSSAAGTYEANGAQFGPALTAAGLAGNIVLANDGVGTTTDACQPLVGFPAGAIAVVDRGTCEFGFKALTAQNAGAIGVIVVNNAPGTPIVMGPGAVGAQVTIPAVHVSQSDGATIKAGLPATGKLSTNSEFGCGSHTATGVPDLANGRLLVYNSSSAGGTCDFFEIVEVPLDDPGSASVINKVDSMHTCHDIGVILGSAMKAACSGGGGARIFSLDPADGGSLDDPELMHHFDVPGVTIGHSAAWSWDGEVLVFGHEPGGGTLANCQTTPPTALVDRTLFFYDHEGNQLGTFVHPRPQTDVENCTWHNYNVVPTDKGRILVSGNYQSGISVLDFTNPANVHEIAFADPAPLIDPDPPVGIEGGGDWSSYWYDGRIYESDMTRGLTIWNLSDNAVAGAKKLGHLNPQTQETSFPLRLRGGG
jgi:PA domain/LVIVD repeat